MSNIYNTIQYNTIILVILFYMNKIPFLRVPPFLTFFPVFLLPLGMPIDSEIMDGF